MNATYVIQWKSKLNGRFGKGTKQFGLQEAERLAEELNREYPEIEHAAVSAPSAVQPSGSQAPERGEEVSSEGAAPSPVEGEEKMVVTGKRMA